jgi:hypothetical protein
MVLPSESAKKYVIAIPLIIEAHFQRFRSASRKQSYCIGSASFCVFFLICTKKKQ